MDMIKLLAFDICTLVVLAVVFCAVFYIGCGATPLETLWQMRGLFAGVVIVQIMHTIINL